MQAADTIQLECLAWAVFDNIMGLGEAPPLFRIGNIQSSAWTSSGQSIQGTTYALPSSNISLFWRERNIQGKTWRPRTKVACKASVLFHDVRCEKGVCGVIFHSQRKTRPHGGRQIIDTSAACGPKHSRNEVDEGVPVFI